MKNVNSDLSAFPPSAQPLACRDIDQAELEMELEQVIAQAYQASPRPRRGGATSVSGDNSSNSASS